MAWRRISRCFRLYCATTCLLVATLATASEYHGQVTFGGLPVPGATVTAIHGSKQILAITDQQGLYFFPDVADGSWTIEIEMSCFSTIRQDVVISPNTPAAKWELQPLPLDQINAKLKPVITGNTQAPPQVKNESATPPDNPIRRSSHSRRISTKAPGTGS